METPVLLIVFNRPDNTRKVFEKIKKIKPKELFIFSDGHRDSVPGEELRVSEIRQNIKDSVDWDCNLYLKFNNENLGCGAGPFSAISWAFEKTEKLIILEDDCVPSLPFFGYCEELLDKYEKDDRVWIISGLNHFEGRFNLVNEDSYFFSKYASPWGWATWKRCWREMDLQMKKLELFRKQGYIFDHVNRKDSAAALAIYKNYINEIGKPVQLSIWDVQFGFTIWSNRGVGIVPSSNLITNIGLTGTHANGEAGLGHSLVANENYKISKHPDFCQTNFLYDDRYFKLCRERKPFIYRLILKVKKLIIKMIRQLKENSAHES
jgi:hypothetical protein